jgi:hypothetical protein
MSMEKDAMHLVCRQCATRFTPELRLIPFDPREDAVEEEFVACGNLMQAEKSFYFDTNVGSFIANIADAQHMKLTSDISRLYGCCGVGGNNGPNLQCDVCGTYVATKHEECCTPHYVVFETSTTQAVMDEGR